MKRKLLNLALRTVTISALLLLCGCGALLPRGSYGIGTPPSMRDRGVSLGGIEVGKITVERRMYEAGRAASSTEFCDYWVEFQGKPVDIAEFGDANSYNNCNAMIVIADPQPTIILGIQDSKGDFVPLIIAEKDGAIQLALVPNCSYRSYTEERMRGWPATIEFDLCGQLIRRSQW